MKRIRLLTLAAMATLHGGPISAFLVRRNTNAFMQSAKTRQPVHQQLQTSVKSAIYSTESRTKLKAKVTDSSTSVSSSSSNAKKTRLSRPERKALERDKKQQQQQTSGKQQLTTNSTKQVLQLSQKSTPEDILRAIKRAQNQRDTAQINNIANLLIDNTDASYAYGYKGSLLARLTVAALHLRLDDTATRIIHTRRVDFRSSMLPMESAAIIRGLLRIGNTTQAKEILQDELSLPLEGTPLVEKYNQEKLKFRALSLASIASRHFFNGHAVPSIRACTELAELGSIIRKAELSASYLEMPWDRLLRGASICQAGLRNGTFAINNSNGDGATDDNGDVKIPCNVVYSVLNAMNAFPSDNSDAVYEILSNALVRRVLFVTGAINMDGCPSTDRGEAVFIGRSNVGKSSLVNMVTNRKSLAYTSKRPGKTQQFNFFAVNDKPGLEKAIKYGDEVPGEKDADSFYIVDVPGFGFAKVPDHIRKQWSVFLDEYITTRATLRVVFHLIDARHGPIDEDERIMQEMSERLPTYVKYVLVLTKADKNVKGSQNNNLGKVSESVMNSVRRAMDKNGVGKATVILTSAETKLGRDDVWRYLRLAAEQ